MQDLTTKTLKELKAIAHQSFEKASRLDIHYSGDKRVRQSWIDYLGRCYNAGLLGTKPEVALADIDVLENIPAAEVEPVEDAIDLQLHNGYIWELQNCVQGVGAIDLQLHNGYIKQSNSGENNHGEFSGTGAESVGADEIAIATELPTGCDCCAKLHGTSGDNQNEGLGSQKGDRLLEESRPDSGDTGRALSHQPPELVSDAILDYLHDIGHKIAPNITPQAPNITPQAAFNDEQPPNRGDGRKSGKLAIGMQVGRKGDRQHAGTILNIYRSKRGKLRAKVQPLNKANFVYFDYDNLIEQKLLYDYQMKPGGFVETGSAFDKKRGEPLEIWTRKLPAIALAEEENWTLAELAAKPIWQVKAIAKRCCDFIPGGYPRTKRTYIRAILAEQIFQGRSDEQTPTEPAPTPILAPKPAVKPRKKLSEAICQQLSLFDVAV